MDDHSKAVRKARIELAGAGVVILVLVGVIIWLVAANSGGSETASDKKDEAEEVTVDPESITTSPDPNITLDPDLNPYEEKDRFYDPDTGKLIAGSKQAREVSFDFSKPFDPQPINGFEWHLTKWGNTYIPKHPTHGPTQFDPFPTGFSRTPNGAALTAIWLSDSNLYQPPDFYIPMLEKHATGKAEGIEIAKAELDAFYAEGEYLRKLNKLDEDQIVNSHPGIFFGWNIESYTDETTKIWLYRVSDLPEDPVYMKYLVSLVWNDENGWQLVHNQFGKIAEEYSLADDLSPVDVDLTGAVQ